MPDLHDKRRPSPLLRQRSCSSCPVSSFRLRLTSTTDWALSEVCQLFGGRKSMKAARWHGRRDVRIEVVPDPTPGPQEVVLHVDWCGICGTDMEEYLTGPHWVAVGHPHPLTHAQAPLALGHEFCGEVVAVGREVRGLRVGDRVAPDTLIYCGHCYWCQRHQVQLCEHVAFLGLMADGGLAEFCVAPEAMCIPLPPSLSSDRAALAETLAVGVHALRRGRLSPGETVVIVGAG